MERGDGQDETQYDQPPREGKDHQTEEDSEKSQREGVVRCEEGALSTKQVQTKRERAEKSMALQPVLRAEQEE